MGSIYQTASQVIIWLGEEAEDTIPAMDLFLKIASGAKLDHGGAAERLKQNLALAGVPPTDDASWNLLSRFLVRPWFSRVWVVQEAVLARRVIVTCGSCQMGWAELHEVAGTIDKSLYGPIVASGHSRIMSLQRYHQRRADKELGLLRLLLVERTQAATNDRDKIFALLGLATDVGELQQGEESLRLYIPPDYRLDVSQVYTNLARSIIIGYNSLSILTAAGLVRQPGIAALPLWVPDWSLTGFALLLMNIKGELKYHACNGRPADCRFSTDGLRLTVSGILYDRISKTGQPWTKGFEPIPVLLNWITLAQGESFSTNSMFAFQRTIIANQSLLGGDGPRQLPNARRSLSGSELWSERLDRTFRNPSSAVLISLWIRRRGITIIAHWWLKLPPAVASLLRRRG